MKQYLNTKPRSDKDSYQPLDEMDFKIKIPDGYEFIVGSLELAGRLYYYRDSTTNTPLNVGDQVFFDHYAGAHNFIDYIESKLTNFGVIESNFFEYSRAIKMQALASTTSDELANDSKYTRELRCGGDDQSTQVLRGSGASVPFSVRLQCALNKANRNFGADDVGDIEMNLRLKSHLRACYGTDNVALANASYSIRNLTLTYAVQPKTASGELVFEIMTMNQQPVNSQLTFMELDLPIPTESVSCTLATQAEINANSMAVHDPNVEEIEWLFNDQNGRLFSFRLDNREEIIANYKRSLSSSPIDDLRATDVSSNWGIGLNFLNVMPKGTKIGLNLKCDADAGAGRTYQMFCFYKGSLRLK